MRSGSSLGIQRFILASIVFAGERRKVEDRRVGQQEPQAGRGRAWARRRQAPDVQGAPTRVLELLGRGGMGDAAKRDRVSRPRATTPRMRQRSREGRPSSKTVWLPGPTPRLRNRAAISPDRRQASAKVCSLSVPSAWKLRISPSGASATRRAMFSMTVGAAPSTSVRGGPWMTASRALWSSCSVMGHVVDRRAQYLLPERSQTGLVGDEPGAVVETARQLRHPAFRSRAGRGRAGSAGRRSSKRR